MVKKSLFPPVVDADVDLSGINLANYERCPLCGRKLKYKLTVKKKDAIMENLKKRKSKGGRPKGSAGRPPDSQSASRPGDVARDARESKTSSVPKSK